MPDSVMAYTMARPLTSGSMKPSGKSATLPTVTADSTPNERRSRRTPTQRLTLIQAHHTYTREGGTVLSRYTQTHARGAKTGEAAPSLAKPCVADCMHVPKSHLAVSLEQLQQQRVCRGQPVGVGGVVRLRSELCVGACQRRAATPAPACGW
jgi:hypothetical protein